MLTTKQYSILQKLLVMGAIMAGVDFFYLSSVSSHFNSVVRSIQGSGLRLQIIPAILCYIVLVGGLYYFIIGENKGIWDAGILGLVIYAVFETTNKAIFKNWDWLSVVMDTAWGGVLFSLTTYIVYKIYGTI